MPTRRKRLEVKKIVNKREEEVISNLEEDTERYLNLIDISSSVAILKPILIALVKSRERNSIIVYDHAREIDHLRSRLSTLQEQIDTWNKKKQ